MAQGTLVSIVVASRGRPKGLYRCLLSLLQQYYRPLEIIVVADPAGCAHVADLASRSGVVLLPYDEANLSAARNLGVAAAHGAVVAFIDDDAAAEPKWITHLLAGFALPGAEAVGGFVLGRNGISHQWRARAVAPDGSEIALTPPSGDAPFVALPPQGYAAKTQGTNCAFRAATLRAMGGFDPAYRYFNDETDLNLRMAAAGHATAFAPLALVHHGFSENAARRADRTPRDLFEIGRSQAVLLRRHLHQSQREAAMAEFAHAQRRRLLHHMVAGTLDPAAVGRLMARLQAGFAAGAEAVLQPLPPLADPCGTPVLVTADAPRAASWRAGHWRRRQRLEKQARALRQSGEVTTLFCFSATPLRHRASFREDGIWEQNGGIFGRSIRSEPAPHLWRSMDRAKHEIRRLRQLRWPEPGGKEG
ncbi:glycosyltransferase family 2 protein [Pseudoruegeria sp. SHC-113]|uniref:glycosyltransferase family 2 protein n=1 Tax=Pseudoruegeria sp. SHC-113 TaxID=2855439 RepID=UPI0021BB624D|nr:glycosyltransferase family A protein [Pseudoruegeria sp. SHC-113]MCT8158519.1 glycosyltransferase family 2 protein [Pseudoruegeria sp. SHC-113]